jgi:predicted phosphoribosyltransferase
MPEPFAAVGQWYRDFSQTTDDEVRRFLRDHARLVATHGSNRSEA